MTGKKFDHKEKLNQAMPLLKKMRACIRHLHAETTTAAEQRQSLIATHKVGGDDTGQPRGRLTALGSS